VAGITREITATSRAAKPIINSTKAVGKNSSIKQRATPATNHSNVGFMVNFLNFKADRKINLDFISYLACHQEDNLFAHWY
jgi:hypothetical protein